MKKHMFSLALAAVTIAAPMILAPLSLKAQDQSAVTGGLNGTVTDASGAVIADAKVTITGPQGSQSATTDKSGHFGFSTLRPGYYDVTAEKAGFSTVTAKHNEVTVSVSSSLKLSLSVGSESTTVEVSAAAVPVDTENTAITSTLSDTFYNSIPMQRNVAAIFYAAPGVQAGQVNTTPNEAGPGSSNPSIGGASGLENLYVVDGVTITDQAFGSIGTFNRYHGALGTGINLAFVKEVDVKTYAFEPQYGKATGGIVQIVTKSGGNDYHGALSAYFAPQAFYAPRRQYFQFGYQQTTPSQTLATPAYDASIELGGYVPHFRDRLFFFGSYDPSLSQNLFSANPNAPSASVGLGVRQSNVTSNNYAAKLTYKASERTTLELTAFGDPSRHNSVPGTSSTTPLSQASSWQYGSQDELARLDSALTNTWTVDLSYAYNHNHFIEFPSTNQYSITDTTATYLPTPGARVSTGLGSFEPSVNNTYSVAANTSKTAQLFGQHTFTVGYAYDHTNFLDEPSRSGALFAIPTTNYQGTDLRTIFSNIPAGAPGSLTNATFQIAPANAANPADATCQLCPVINGFRSYASISRGTYQGLNVKAYGRYHSGFGEDVYRMNRFLTLNLGVRWEQQRVGGTLFGYNFGPSWSPRVGFNFDPTGNSTSKFFFNFGRNFYALPLDAAIRQLGNEQDDTSYTFAPIVAADGTISVVPDTAHNLNGTPRRTVGGVVGRFGGPNFSSSTGEGILPGTKQEYEDEYVIGYERNLGRSIVLKARYTDRRLGRIIEDIGSQSPEGSTLIGNYTGGIANPGPKTDIAVNESEIIYTPAQYAAAQAASANAGGAYVAPVAGCTAANDTSNAIGGLFVDGRNNPVGGACFQNAATADAGPGDGLPDGFVKAVRRFNSVEFEVDKRFSNHWLAVVNFRWGNLFGNYEGSYRNDNGQADPGISSLFDFTAGKLGLLGDQFTPGYLSTDRRAVGNIFLSYNFAGSTGAGILGNSLKGLTLGLGARGQSGVPASILGDHPVYLNQGEVPIGGRGAAGRFPSSQQLDLHTEYAVPGVFGKRFGDTSRVKLTMDMFNVTNSQYELARVQYTQQDAPAVGVAPALNVDYGRPTQFQGPFYARGSVRFEF